MGQKINSGARAVVMAAAILAGGVTVIAPTIANAFPRTVRIYCKSDYQRFCPAYSVESPKMVQCMKANRNNLSPVCKKALIDSGYAKQQGY